MQEHQVLTVSTVSVDAIEPLRLTPKEARKPQLGGDSVEGEILPLRHNLIG